MTISPVYKDLEQYGIIGNLETCALCGSDGSIDWLCFPYLESPSIFAALLDIEKGGHFRIRPSSSFTSVQLYKENTNILMTGFTCLSGRAAVTDFMPVQTGGTSTVPRALFRKVECTAGSVAFELSFQPRVNYARAIPRFTPGPGGITALWGTEELFLQSAVPLSIDEAGAQGSFVLRAGEQAWFILSYNDRDIRTTNRCGQVLADTTAFWKGWAQECIHAECAFEEPWHDLLIRSGLILKLLTNPETGAIAAAATTSIPEQVGGVRNWDYRYAWIRDSSFTVQALYHLGYEKEAQDFKQWIFTIVKQAQDPSDMLILYGLHGETDLAEYQLDHLAGYKDSKPVRIGNGAARQKQLDIYGEMLNAVYEITRYGEAFSKNDWTFAREIVSFVARVWDTEDSGIWEVRGGPRHFVYSKLMCCVALDRGIRIAEENAFEAPVCEWKETEKTIRQAIIEHGFNQKRNSFVQSFGSGVLDASTLLIPLMGFLPPDNPMVKGTIDAVMNDLLMDNGLVRRYESPDGLPGSEGAFLLCSFWLVKALAVSNRTEEAQRIFHKLLHYASPLGIFSEEIDPQTGRQIGNVPQAFSHIGFVNSALYLGIAKGRKHRGPRPVGLAYVQG